VLNARRPFYRLQPTCVGREQPASDISEIFFRLQVSKQYHFRPSAVPIRSVCLFP
jgi:hypothetical protein